MSTLLLYGDQKAIETAERMILEAIDNRAQKKQQREKEYARKRDEKSRNRQLYHLRHTRVCLWCGGSACACMRARARVWVWMGGRAGVRMRLWDASGMWVWA